MLKTGLKKKCNKCHKIKLAEEFNKDKKRKEGLNYWCKDCQYEYNKKYYQKNKLHLINKTTQYSKSKQGKKTQRKSQLKYKFDLTLEEYKQLLKQQNDMCAICGKTPKQNKKALAVDHDHRVKKEYDVILIRGLLCTSCNRYVIGLMKDNKTIFAGVIKYLTKALEDYSKFMKGR